MKRSELDHLLRAAGELTGHRRFVLVGSTAIFAWHASVPPRMTISREADLFADGVSRDQAEEIADQLEDIGHLSLFDDTHGYYADGVSPETAKLPPDWRSRSTDYYPTAANGVVAIVPHPEDIAASKLYAGRPKDLEWVSEANVAGFIDPKRLADRVEAWVGIGDDVRALMLDRIAALSSSGTPSG